MRLSGKLNSVDLSSDLKSILFRNFKAVEGLIFSTVEDTKQNTCSATFKFIGKDIPFTVGKEYTFDIDDSTPVDDSFIIVMCLVQRFARLRVQKYPCKNHQ